MEQLALFNYAGLDETTRVFVQEKTQAIHARLKRTAEDIIAIGQDLIEVNEKLSTGGRGGTFLEWIQSEFEMSQAAAYRFMQVAKRFNGKLITVINFPTKVLYELAAPSTPETVIEMVETKQIPATLPAIREAKQGVTEHNSITHSMNAANIGRTIDVSPILPSVQSQENTPFLDDWKPIIPVTEIPKHNPNMAVPKGYEFWKAEKPADSPQTKINTPFPESIAFFAQWQHDNLALGLDRFGDVLAHQDEGEQREEVTTAKSAILTALQSSESNEWYTPHLYVDAARELMGDIDIDPASCELANQVIRATCYYTKEDNGLMQSWQGRVWLNPPYGVDSGVSNQEVWSRQLIERYKAGLVSEAVLLVNANTEAKWFQPLYEYLICFTNHRIRFYNGDGISSQPTQGNALVYLGKQKRRFIEIFSRFGEVVRRASANEY